MSDGKNLDENLRSEFERRGIDADLSLRILEAWNSGKLENLRSLKVRDLPTVDGKTVLDFTGDFVLELPEEEAFRNLRKKDPRLDPAPFGLRKTSPAGTIVFRRRDLEALGIRLYPLLSFGILNGGSATTYADVRKNRSLSEPLYDLLETAFLGAAELSRGRPKGITPAYANPDGSPGFSFLELKMRNLLLGTLKWREAVKADGGSREDLSGLKPLTPLFQMTSVFTDREIREAYAAYRESSLLRDLIAEAGIDVTLVETGVQPLVSAFTHSSEGETKSLFTSARGEIGGLLGLPGGHGQSFRVLREVYRRLYARGKRFIYLGNVDNLGFVPEPAALAVLALTGREAGFDFSFKTAVDVKGGILVVDDRGRLNCVDIGPALGIEEVQKAEASGKRPLFNAATGLFDLENLVNRLDEIIENLPLRFSDQDKEAGKYSQAEQVTWEVVGLLENILVFGVRKERRFLAAKMLLESLLTSGVGLDDPAFPKDFRGLAETLREGFRWNMEKNYAMRLRNRRWEPLPFEELGAFLKEQ